MTLGPYRIVMIRHDLDRIAQHPLAEGYRMRPFGPGDRAKWVRIQRASDSLIKITTRTFESSFGDDFVGMIRRGLFLVAPDGSDVGSITAWYHHSYGGRRWGRIHWVAIVPAHRGKALGKAMMTTAMNRLRALGHRRAMLGTHTKRTAAIKIYLDCGFVPDMSFQDADRAWAIVRRVLRHPGLAASRQGP